MIRVKATREGLPGKQTSSTYVIEGQIPFVALPDRKALHRVIVIRNPANGKQTTAIVLDVGPWNISDDAYVFHGARPLSETGIKVDGKGNLIHGATNGAGIDLGGRIWNDLGMTDNGEVEWEFAETT